ncbi:MAG: hypothetical protein ACW98U_12670 [Candidatus Thorarchaeota archaeon]|jgi:hypothetical protein
MTMIDGKIVSAQLGEFSKRQIVYGFIGIELQDRSHIKIKVDSYTAYETLVVGDDVVVEVVKLANTDILVAKTIRLKTSQEMDTEDKPNAEASA